jgi:hypothetical protein
MAVAQLATKIDVRIKRLLDAVCELRGFKINRFIEDAILEKIEEMEDLEEIKKIRKEKTIPLAQAIAELKKHGKI